MYWRWYRLWDRFGGPLKDLEWRFNHPDSQPWGGYPRSTNGPRSEKVCAFLDAISSNWFHD